MAGKTQSCGCLQKEKASLIGKKTGATNGAKSAKDLTNQLFGRLTALKPTDKRQGSNVIWSYQCNCGNITFAAARDLLSGNTQSCGCLRSTGQEKIASLLQDNNIPFVTEKIFDNCIYPKTLGNPRFDFYVNNAYLIEYDGIQHFQEVEFFKGVNLEEQKARDNYKVRWCLQNNIPLIRIPYTRLSKLCIEDLCLETSEYIINK